MGRNGWKGAVCAAVAAVALFGWVAALSSLTAVAQVSCSEAAPLCPDDGATPTGSSFPNNCICPRPTSCALPSAYECTLGTNSNGVLEWSCRCTPPGVPPDDTTGITLPTPPDCGGITCPGGSAPIVDGTNCLCPTPAPLCTGHCLDGTVPTPLSGICVCPDVESSCKSIQCSDGTHPTQVTAGGGFCVCKGGTGGEGVLQKPE